MDCKAHAFLLLQNLESILDQLTQIAENKQTAIVRCDIGTLESMVQLESELHSKVDSILQQLDKEFLDNEAVSLNRENISVKVLRLRRLNEINQSLLSKSLDIVSREIREICPSGYGYAGPKRSYAFDART